MPFAGSRRGPERAMMISKRLPEVQEKTTARRRRRIVLRLAFAPLFIR
jgi:hypothetical protein